MSDAQSIKGAVAHHAADFAAWLFPGGKRVGAHWHVGDVSGNPGKSLAIDLSGEFAGGFRDWATGERGDCFALTMSARGLDFASAKRTLGKRYRIAAPPIRLQPAPPTSGLELPADATPGTRGDWQELATLRNFAMITPATAALHLGTLFFGTVHGFRCWIFTDCRRLCAEARRMDGKPFPPLGTLGERKAHTLRGSVKSWPVGLAVERYAAAEFRAVLAVEGGPDYFAALHFSLHGTADCLPIAFLGAGTAGAIHPEALALLRGKRVRFYPHADKSGSDAAEKWAAQLRAIGGVLDRFEFAGLCKRDGSPLKDLNDSNVIHPDDAGELAELLP